MKASILGAAGYIGGEVLRLLLDHPEIEVAQVTSNSLARKPVSDPHPNLRQRTDLRFVRHDDLKPCDVLFMASLHGQASKTIDNWKELAPVVIDLSGDFRLKNPQLYKRYYREDHPVPAMLKDFVQATPEIYREELKTANLMAVPGCMATPALLALHPFGKEGLLTDVVHVDARTGSSGSGAVSSPGTHHADRSGAMRVFKPAGHRHEAEISQNCGQPVLMSATGVEAVRGVQVVVRAKLKTPMTDGDVRALYRTYYGEEPFIRVVKRQSGVHRLPEPKLLQGTNYCDLGFELVGDSQHIVLIGAVDNLVKGGAGAAVQSMNVRFGWPEHYGLAFSGLHPC